MNDNFNKINRNNKQIQRIVESAYEEFGNDKIDNVSLNSILKKSGVAKGTFYHYFKDKNDLVNYIINDAIELQLEMLNNFDEIWKESDIVKRLLDISIIKLNFIIDNPYKIKLFSSLDNQEYIRKHFANKTSELDNLTKRVLEENIDTSLIKDDVSIDQLISYSIILFSQIFLNLVESTNYTIDDNEAKVLISKLTECSKFIKQGYYK